MLFFLLVDIISSSYHYYHLAIDGDITKLSAPILWYEDVLNDPFGLDAIINHKEYGGAGRYFAHESTVIWYNYVYKAIHFFVKNPVVSLFLCNSLFATCMHLLFLFLIYLYINVTNKVTKLELVFILCLATIFIQYNKFYDSIGIIDRSMSYAFFYALPVFSLCIYFYFIYKKYHQPNYRISIFHSLILIPFAIFISFHGPLIQPLVFIITLFAVLSLFVLKNEKLKILLSNKNVLFQWIFILVLCIYAYYVSKFNSEKNISISVVERYKLLIKGLFYILTQNLAMICIFLYLLYNSIVIYKNEIIQKNIYFKQLLFVILFAGLYLFLLPLGGYRVYRPYIVRYDTFMPITLSIVYLLIFSSSLIIKNSIIKFQKMIFFGLSISIILVFSYVDKNLERENNACQHRSLYALNKNSDSTLYVSKECNLGTWQIEHLNDPYVLEMLTKLFRQWEIIKPYQQLK